MAIVSTKVLDVIKSTHLSAIHMDHVNTYVKSLTLTQTLTHKSLISPQYLLKQMKLLVGRTTAFAISRQ